MTVPEAGQRSAVAALGLDPLEAQIRQVFFFDTPELALNKAGVVVRARRVQKKGDDSVVKLRPVVPSELPPKLRSRPEFGVEVDAMPGGFVCSGSLKGTPRTGAVRKAVAGKLALAKLFSKQQRAFFEDHAPPGVGFDDLNCSGRSSCSSSSPRPGATTVGWWRNYGCIPTRRGCSSSRRSVHRPRLSTWPPGREPSWRNETLALRASKRRRRARPWPSSPGSSRRRGMAASDSPLPKAGLRAQGRPAAASTRRSGPCARASRSAGSCGRDRPGTAAS